MKKRTVKIMLAALLLAGCTAGGEQPEATVPTEPVTYEDTGAQVIHAGYYEMTEKIYRGRGTSAKEVRGLVPDEEITTSYDYSGRRTARKRQVREDDVLVFLYEERYEYDADGNVIRVDILDEAGNPDGTAEKAEDGWHEYDASGMEVPAAARDSWGNRMQETADDGSMVLTEYNRNGRPLKQESHAADGTLLCTVEYSYPANDVLPDGVTVKNGSGTITAEYYLSRGALRNSSTYSRYLSSADPAEPVCTVKTQLYEDSALTAEILVETESAAELREYEYR